MSTDTAKHGRDLPQAKLDEQKVREIRRQHGPMTLKQQAEKYGVHWRTIEKVVRGETWWRVR